MAEILVSVANTIYITHSCPVDNRKTLPFYGSLSDADNYFYLHEKHDDWNVFTREQKLRFLVSASRRIDRLNFIGQKADSDQFLQFPRTGDTVVPYQIEQATYEVALRLGEGIDPDTEADNLSRTSEGYGMTKTTYDRSFVPDYIRAGIPSQTAWNLLFPFLRSILNVEIVRSS